MNTYVFDCTRNATTSPYCTRAGACFSSIVSTNVPNVSKNNYGGWTLTKGKFVQTFTAEFVMLY